MKDELVHMLPQRIQRPTVAADLSEAHASFKLAAARQAAYPEPTTRSRRSSVLMILLIGLLAFGLLFVVGYFAGQYLIH